MATVNIDTEILLEDIRNILRYNENYKVVIDLFGLYGTIYIEVVKICMNTEPLFIDRGMDFNRRLFNVYTFLTDNLKLTACPKK